MVLDDACTAWWPAVHAASLRSLELLYCDIMKAEELVKNIRRSLRIGPCRSLPILAKAAST
ncbi:MAG: hypothetical protein JW839_20125 [Candidatus Lokiarchaeota archaeon]|nr:hypothetical protein [Candidatus Lokiarchaeota archaeon]